MNFKFARALFPFVMSLAIVGCSGNSPEQYLDKALEYRESGENQAAILELKNAIRISPNLASLRFELGKTYMLNNEFEFAEKELSRALELGFDENEVMPLLSEVYQRTGADVALSNMDIVYSELTQVAQLEIGYRKALSYISLEKKALAYDLTERLLKLDADTVYKDLIALVPYLAESNYKAALTGAEAAKTRAPLNSDVLLLNARLYALNERPLDAIETYKTYVKTKPGDTEVKFVLASLMVYERMADDAAPLIDELLLINDQSPYLNKLKSISHVAEEEYGLALSFAEKAINSGSLDPVLRMVAGFTAYKTGQYNKAVEHLSFIADMLPDDHDGLRLLAASQINSASSAQVEGVLDRLQTLSNDDLALFANAAVELAKADDEEGAKSVLARTQDLVDEENLAQFGVVKLSLDNLGSLMRVSSEVAHYQLDDSRAVLAAAYLATSQHDEVLEVARGWLKEDPSNAYAHLLQAEVAYAQEALVESAKHAKAVLNTQPNNSDANALLAKIALDNNQFDVALDYANKAIENNFTHQKAWRAKFATSQDQTVLTSYLHALLDYVHENESDLAMRLFVTDMSLKMGKVDTAVALLEPIEFTGKTPQRVYGLKGQVLLHAKRIDDAEAHFSNWLASFPKQEEAALGLIKIVNAKRNFEKGLSIATAFLESEYNVQLETARAYFLAITRRSDEARQAYVKFDNSLKNQPFVRGINARIGLNENRPNEVLDDAIAAYKYLPSYDHLALLVQLYVAADQKDKALTTFHTHIDAKPQDVLAKMLLAELYFVEQPEDALSVYLDIIETVPNNVVALNNAAFLFKEKDQLDSAEQFAKRAFGLVPGNPGIADTYAQILIKKGQVDDAVKVYDNALFNADAAEFIQLNYIESLLIQGNKEAAQRKLEGMRFSRPASFLTLERLHKEYELNI